MTMNDAQVGREVDKIMADIHNTREQAAIDRAEAEIAIQAAAERAAESRTILGVEAAKLIDRIDWLHRHKWRARLVGRQAAIATIGDSDTLATPVLLTPPEPEEVEGKHGGEHLLEGYRFNVTRYDRSLRIERVRQEFFGVASTTFESWRITPQRDAAGKVVTVGFDSTACQDYRRQELARLLDQHTQTYPWLDKYSFYDLDGEGVKFDEIITAEDIAGETVPDFLTGPEERKTYNS